jgi:hypothetical protein
MADFGTRRQSGMPRQLLNLTGEAYERINTAGDGRRALALRSIRQRHPVMLDDFAAATSRREAA